MQYKIIETYPVRELMEKKKLTIRQLAKKSGIHYTYLSRLLTHKSIASEEIKNRIVNALKS